MSGSLNSLRRNAVLPSAISGLLLKSTTNKTDKVLLVYVVWNKKKAKGEQNIALWIPTHLLSNLQWESKFRKWRVWVLGTSSESEPHLLHRWVAGLSTHPPSLRLRRSIMEQKWLLLILPSFLFILSSCSLFLLLQVISTLPTLCLWAFDTGQRGVRQKDERWKEKQGGLLWGKSGIQGRKYSWGLCIPTSQESRLD